MIWLNRPFPQFTIPAVYDGNISYLQQIGYLTAEFNKLSDWVIETFKDIEKKIPEQISAIAKETVDKAIEDYSAGVDVRFNDITNRINNIDTQIRSMLNDINTIGSMASKNKSDITKINKEIDDINDTITEEINRLDDTITLIKKELQDDYNEKIELESAQRQLADTEIWKALDNIQQKIYPDIHNYFRGEPTSIQDYFKDWYKNSRYGGVTSEQMDNAGVTIDDLEQMGMTVYEFDFYARDYLRKFVDSKNLNGDYRLVYTGDTAEQPSGTFIPVTADRIRIAHSGGTNACYIDEYSVVEGDTMVIHSADYNDSTVVDYYRKVTYVQRPDPDNPGMDYNGILLSDCISVTNGVRTTANDNNVILQVWALNFN